MLPESELNSYSYHVASWLARLLLAMVTWGAEVDAELEDVKEQQKMKLALEQEWNVFVGVSLKHT